MEFHVLLGLLIRPEFYSYNDIEQLSSLFKALAALDDTVLLSFSKDFDEVFTNIISRFYTKMLYERNVIMKTYNETEYITSFSYNTYEEKLSDIQDLTEVAWMSLEKYLVRSCFIVNSATTQVQYSTNTAKISLEYRVANTLNGTTYSIYSTNSYTVSLPSNLFTGTSVTDLTTSIRVLSIDWAVSPKMLTQDATYSSISDSISFVLIDNSYSKVDISSKSITFSLPGSLTSITSSKGCMAWTLIYDTDQISDSTCVQSSTSTATNVFPNCQASDCNTNSKLYK